MFIIREVELKETVRCLKMAKTKKTEEKEATVAVEAKEDKEDSKKVIIDKDEHYLVDYVGQVIEEVNNKLLIDASLPIFVDKKEGIGVGDYVTGNGHHTIQAYLEKDDKDAIKP